MIRFTLLGFPVTVHWMFWAIMAMLGANRLDGPRGFAMLAIWVIAGFISILIHELGHTLLQRKFGARAEIVLYAMGGLAIPDRSFTRVQQIIISLGGPFLQIAVGLVAWQVIEHSSGDAWYVRAFFVSFMLVSIFWGLLNLLPIYPLDGGQVLKGILGPRRERFAYLVGMLCAAALCIYVLTRPNPSAWNAILCGLFAWDNFQRWQGQKPPSALEPR
jgi:stage IV sporulation protein FB